MSGQGNRFKNMDMMKALGIIYVVFGHTLVNPMHDFIYMFHMPLFYFVSGFFYNEKYTFQPLTFIKKRIKTLYIPFLKYELIFLSLHNVLYNINLYSDRVFYRNEAGALYTSADFIKNIFKIITFCNTEQLLGAFWFFTVLFTINIAFIAIRFTVINIFKQRNELIISFIVFSVFCFGTYLNYNSVILPRNINTSCSALLFFYMGFLYQKVEHRIPVNFYYSILGVVIVITGIYLWRLDFIKNCFFGPFALIIFSLSGIYFNLYLSQRLAQKNIKTLEFIGGNTIIIMALHFLCFKLINLIQVTLYGYPDYMLAEFPVLYAYDLWFVLYGIAGVFIPVMIKKSAVKLRRRSRI